MSQALPSILVTQHRNNDGTLRGVARYGEPIAALELDGKRGTVEAEALSVRVLETRADGSVLVAYLIERANAFRGRWVAALSPSHAMEESLRLCVGSRWWNTEETWFELDRGLHTPRLERARSFLQRAARGGLGLSPSPRKTRACLASRWSAAEMIGSVWPTVAHSMRWVSTQKRSRCLRAIHSIARVRCLGWSDTWKCSEPSMNGRWRHMNPKRARTGCEGRRSSAWDAMRRR